MNVTDYERTQLASELSDAINMAFEKQVAAPYSLSLSFHTAATLRDILTEYVSLKEKARMVS